MAKELSLEAYASMSAHLVHFRKADPREVLDRLGIDPEGARAAQKAWSLALREDLETTDMPLTAQMAATFGPVLKRLEETRPPLPSIGPRAQTAAPGAALASLPAGMRGYASVDTTQAPTSRSSAPAVPFGAAPAAVPGSRPAMPQIPAGMRRFASVTGTEAAPSVVNVRAPLPFSGAAPARSSSTRAETCLPIERYTHVHAELSLGGAGRAQVLARYGLDEHRLAQNDAFWGPRIEADAALRALWDAAYAAHIERLTGRAR